MVIDRPYFFLFVDMTQPENLVTHTQSLKCSFFFLNSHNKGKWLWQIKHVIFLGHAPEIQGHWPLSRLRAGRGECGWSLSRQGSGAHSLTDGDVCTTRVHSYILLEKPTELKRNVPSSPAMQLQLSPQLCFIIRNTELVRIIKANLCVSGTKQ